MIIIIKSLITVRSPPPSSYHYTTRVQRARHSYIFYSLYIIIMFYARHTIVIAPNAFVVRIVYTILCYYNACACKICVIYILLQSFAFRATPRNHYIVEVPIPIDVRYMIRRRHNNNNNIK